MFPIPRARPLYIAIPLFIAFAVLILQLVKVVDELQALHDALANIGSSSPFRGSASAHGANPHAKSKSKHPRPHLDQTKQSGLSASESIDAELPTVKTKAVVVPRLSNEDTRWLEEDVEGWAPFVYTVDNRSAPLHTPRNKGRESLPYLQYILDHYDELPDIVAFMHAHKDGWPQGWHTDNEAYDNALSLKRLKTDYVQKQGFVNLRCNLDPGCPAGVNLEHIPWREPPEDDPSGQTAYYMPKAWEALFPNETLPKIIASPCCAQFAVSREQIRKRPQNDYLRYYQWIYTTELSDRVSGRIMEYLWHIIFGKDPVFCHDSDMCYCEMYGTSCQWVGFDPNHGWD